MLKHGANVIIRMNPENPDNMEELLAEEIKNKAINEKKQLLEKRLSRT